MNTKLPRGSFTLQLSVFGPLFLPSVLHLTSWLSSRGGGIPPVVRALQRGQTALGWTARAAGLTDPLHPDETDGSTLLGNIEGPSAFGYSPGLQRKLAAQASDVSVVHVHGLWMHPGIIARRAASATKSPLVISPHGMLEPWAIQNSRWKKRLAAWLFENRNLRSAACLHALCEAEARNFRNYGLTNPIAVIPNGVEIQDPSNAQGARREAQSGNPMAKGLSDDERNFPVRDLKADGKKVLLFLGRIHPKKGLANLIRAWRVVQGARRVAQGAWRVAQGAKRQAAEEWVLAIAGPDEGGHEAQIKRLATELGLDWGDYKTPEPQDDRPEAGSQKSVVSGQWSVVFLGPLYGDAKKRALAGADAFVLPSFSEGFSMAVLEAAACGLPVLLTAQCNFPELVAADAAVEVRPDVESCETGLRQMLSLSVPERRATGQRGRVLIERNYTWPRIATRMISVYSWLRGGGKRPECVLLE